MRRNDVVCTGTRLATGYLSCSECNRAMRLDEHDVQGFRERLADAVTRVDMLLDGHSPE